MSRSEKALVVVLRGGGVLLLTALIPAVMPFAWMDQIHRHLGMGELPESPITGYLTRSLSALYALHGALVFFLSLDVRRYLPVVKCLAVLCIVFGAGMIVLDVAVGLPLPWVLGEGPSVIILGIVLLWLAGRVRSGQTVHRDEAGRRSTDSAHSNTITDDQCLQAKSRRHPENHDVRSSG